MLYYFTEELQQKIKAMIEGTEEKQFRQWAIDADMSSFYDGIYTALCEEVHSGPISLHPYLIIEVEDVATGFKYGPDVAHDFREDILELCRFHSRLETFGGAFQVRRRNVSGGYQGRL